MNRRQSATVSYLMIEYGEFKTQLFSRGSYCSFHCVDISTEHSMAHMMHREATLGSSSLRQRFLTPVNLTSMSKRGASQRPVTAFASGDAVLHRGFCVPQKQILQRPRRIDQGVRGSKLVAKAAESSPFPFNESNYHRQV